MAGEAKRTALPLAVCLFFNEKFAYLFFLIEFVLFIYKGVKYNYPQQVRVCVCVCVFVRACVRLYVCGVCVHCFVVVCDCLKPTFSRNGF